MTPAKLDSITVWGKDKCGKCSAAAEKLDRLGLVYAKESMQDVLDGLNWNHAALVEYAMSDGDLPIITIGDRGHTYSSAMKILRKNS